MIEAARMAEVFVDLSDTVLGTFDIIEFLDNLTERCVELLAVDAAGLMLVNQQGRLNLMASTVQEVRVMGLFELQVQEGPSLECVGTGQAITNVFVAETTRRWPKFGPAAVESGLGSTDALPMQLRGKVIGALNLLSRDERRLTETDLAVGQAMADLATIGLLHQRQDFDHTTVNEQLHTALNSRVLVEQAKGALADRARISLSEAFNRMRSHARRNQLKLTDVAAEVVSGDFPYELDPAHS